ncbi:AGE family epimerase/isomerase [Palleronia sp. LCG004]|uniref:AGE family epimerase/isomerase n=1 Tax=Palleronia sp. LCG004 TaxID=3079304 RepID=UPI002943A02C|nr:AGE family epimerase/isomerase [Palleronia sp. LCG004]WOI57669.1 AGE family epimerase/isomerase [Palleronia sp. LCG004]
MPDSIASANTRLADPGHRAFLKADAEAALDFFAGSLRADGGFDTLDTDGTPLPRAGQELHNTTRMIHSYALGHAIGHPASERMIDAGMAFLWNRHRDTEHGGYFWSVDETGVHRDEKLAYGHVFVLLAASSATEIGHPDAPRLLADISEILERHFWDDSVGRLEDEFTRDWQPFSQYRGMNANMHGVEGLLATFEATGDRVWLDRAGRILDFFVHRMASEHDWRIPEHYDTEWRVDPDYSGDPMFRPSGTTPGHSFEFARLLLQHWDLSGRPEGPAIDAARNLVDRAEADALQPSGGYAYTLDRNGRVDIPDRYWWPVTEAIGVRGALLKVAPRPEDDAAYARDWDFARARLIDGERGGWVPELDAEGRPQSTQFAGKPDLYHALQADLFPLVPGISAHLRGLAALG